MRRLLRFVRTLLTVLGTLAVLLAVAVAGLLWLTLPPKQQSLAIAGLSAPVDIGFDQHGIPRIRAANLTDAAAALGYVHARDRMFQMELMRRAASGRLSELFGPLTLPMDKEMRTLGLRRRAEADLPTLPADVRTLLQAYANGVNAWIAARGRLSAPEFLLLGSPEPWTPVDSLLWSKTMALWLSMNWRQELARWRLSTHLPEDTIEALWPPQHQAGQPAAMLDAKPHYATNNANRPDLRLSPGDCPPVMPGDCPPVMPGDCPPVMPGEGRASTSSLPPRPWLKPTGGCDIPAAPPPKLPAFPAPFTQPDHASNGWAVDATHTTTGAPLLAGDPHLAFGFPGLWYLARIDTPDETLAGATAPGVPGLILGHNRHVAWTFTSTGADVQDIFIETPVGPDQYQTQDGPRPFTLRTERIRVRGRPDVMLTVRETRHGPVISDLFDAGGPILAVAMANLQPGDTTAAGALALNRAQNIADVGRAAALISSPVQNLMAADRQTIALFVTGRVPIRRSGDGAAPVPGATGAFDWIGWASGEQLPHYVAPPSGRLVNANDRVAPPDFPVFLGRDWFADWRARRIRELLSATDRHDAAGFARMQMDVKSLFAAQVLPALLSIPAPDGIAGRALALLNGWDGTMAMDRPQPLIFTAWIDRFYQNLMARIGVPPEDMAAAAPPAEFVPSALLPGGAHWCGGDCAGMLRDALTQAIDDLSHRFGADPAAWRWARPHQAAFAHPLLSAIPWLRGLGTLRIAVPGSDTTIDAAGTRLGHLTAVHGPEFRGVYDLADLDRSRFTLAPGQSGNLLRRTSRDLLADWREGTTLTLGPFADQVTATIRLTQ